MIKGPIAFSVSLTSYDLLRSALHKMEAKYSIPEQEVLPRSAGTKEGAHEAISGPTLATDMAGNEGATAAPAGRPDKR
jgi:hypothetical protein